MRVDEAGNEQVLTVSVDPLDLGLGREPRSDRGDEPVTDEHVGQTAETGGRCRIEEQDVVEEHRHPAGPSRCGGSA